MKTPAKCVAIFLPLAVVVAAPMLLRESDADEAQAAEARLTVITPHNESIRREFGEAFVEYWKERTGQTVHVNWRVPGGTSEIGRLLGSAYEAAADLGKEGVGIDVFFGGGAYDFNVQAKLDRFEKLRVFETHPELFGDDGIPATLSGETYYDPERRWVGAALSSFGVCYNEDLIALRGLEPPTSWEDLGDPRYARGIALADTTKSASVTKSIEMLIQQLMQEELEAASEDEEREEVLARGWAKSLNLIQRISANARYFTNSSAKIPRDVADGNAVAGMCIGFYGRATSEGVKRPDGSSRLTFLTPVGGSSISVDPIAVLKGAPQPKLAQAFVEFVLSREGQMLWAAAPGSVPGPKRRALRRLPIRRDLYQGKTLEAMVDREALPYEMAKSFTFDPTLTGPLFTPIRNIVRVMCIDTHPEMKEAWQALIDADFPPEASARFFDVTAASYERAGGEIRSGLKGSKVEAVKLLGELAREFRRNYLEAKRLAEEGR